MLNYINFEMFVETGRTSSLFFYFLTKWGGKYGNFDQLCN